MNQQKQYAVIADDLTGAGDTGVQFSKAGLAARIVLGDWNTDALAGADIIVAQTESRALSPEMAYATVHACSRKLAESGVLPLYKKVDSTLRGQIGAELDAMMDVWNIKLALLCPAFPANGRTLAGGYLMVDGKLVSSTPVGRDPVTPVRESHIPTLLAGQSKRRVQSISCTDIAKGLEHLQSIFSSLEKADAIIVADAMQDADLALLTQAAQTAAPETLLVGAAGLAAPLASYLGTLQRRRKPVLTVVGSVNPVSREQLKRLQSSGVGLFLATASDLLADGQSWQNILEEKSRKLADLLIQGTDVALATPGNREEVEEMLNQGNTIGLERGELTARIALRTTEIAARSIELVGNDAVAGLVLTGGDMAQAMLEHLGSLGVDLHTEVSPGIPLGILNGGKAQGMRVVTKAGGFGAPDALLRAVHLLSEQ